MSMPTLLSRALKHIVLVYAATHTHTMYLSAHGEFAFKSSQSAIELFIFIISVRRIHIVE